MSFESIIFYNSGQVVKFKFWLIRTIHCKHKFELKWKGQLPVKSLHDGKVTLSTGLIKLNFFVPLRVNQPLYPGKLRIEFFVSCDVEYKLDHLPCFSICLASTSVSKRAKLKRMVPSFMSSPVFQPVASTL